MSDLRKTPCKTPFGPLTVLGAALLCAPWAAQAQTPHQFAFSVNAAGNAGAVNPLLLGTNVQWFNNGDGVLTWEGNGAHRTDNLIPRVKEQKPSVLRYWASDMFDWEKSLPAYQYDYNSQNLMPDGSTTQRTNFGSQQYLEFSRAIGAQSLISLNMHQGWLSGTNTYQAGSDAIPAQHASQWQAMININAGYPSTLAPYPPLGKVTYWELGNEPYLQQEAGPLGRTIEPARFGLRAGQTASALLAQDSSAQIILPMTMGVRNGRVASHYWSKGSNQPAPYRFFTEVMPHIAPGTLDAVGLHNAYMPAAGASIAAWPTPPNGDNDRCPEDYYWSAMAAPLAVIEDIDTTVAHLNTNYKNRFRSGAAKVAITEYGPVFAFVNPTQPVRSKPLGSCAPVPRLGSPESDLSKWGATPAGGLYVADLIRALSENKNVLLAAHWSVHGNDAPDGSNRFGGLVTVPGNYNHIIERPIHKVLKMWSSVLVPGAWRLPITHTLRETKSTPSIGYSAARTALPVIEAAATRYTVNNKNMLAILVINKDPLREGSGTITVKNTTLVSAATELLFTTTLLNDSGDATFTWVSEPQQVSANKIKITLPPGSVRLLRVAL